MDVEGPRLQPFYNGAILQSVESDSTTFPPILILFESTGLIYQTYAIELTDSFNWYLLPSCPQNPLNNHTSTHPISIETRLEILPGRPSMCALSETDILVMTHFERRGSPALWVISRRGRTPQSGMQNYLESCAYVVVAYSSLLIPLFK